MAICQIFYHDIRGAFTEYASDKYQHNTDIQPSLLFKELTPKRGDDAQRKLPFGIERPADKPPTTVPLLACPAVRRGRVRQHCWTSQQWHPRLNRNYAP